MSVAEIHTPAVPFVDFERNPEAPEGVLWDHFITAVGTFVNMNAGAYAVSIEDVATAFNTTPECVREAVRDHPWLDCDDDQEPSQQLIWAVGE